MVERPGPGRDRRGGTASGGGAAAAGGRPVVVGVDGSDDRRDAVRWAAAEAAARQRPLSVVHVAPARRGRDGDGAEWLGDVPDAVTEVLAEARRDAQAIMGDGAVGTRVVTGDPAAALLGASRDAETLVVGSRGLRGWAGMILGSVSVAVAANATCPVVVLRRLHTARPGPSANRVVVGVDGTLLSESALAYAFRAAAQRDIGLTAMHGWSARGPAGLLPVADDAVATEAVHRRLLEEAVAPWQQLFPWVDVQLCLAKGPPALALSTESAGAALVVVGSRGRGGVRGLLLGSVSQELLRQAHCPVAIVRSDADRLDELGRSPDEPTDEFGDYESYW